MQVRHATASGRLDECWSFIPSDERPVVSILTKAGNVPVALEIAVCSAARPRFGAHPIARVDGESWRILPSRFVRMWPAGVESLVAISYPLAELGHRSLILTNTPADVSAAIEKI